MQCRALYLIALSASLATGAAAQATDYPSFQTPRVTDREFNFAVADAGRGGTTLLFQWREGAATRSQLSLDAGLVARDGDGELSLALAGNYGYQMHRASADVPLDLLLTLGVGVGLGDRGSLRAPIGVSLGHRFELDRDMAITPYAHPRISFDFCDCGRKESELGINFDLGANLEITPSLAVRAARGPGPSTACPARTAARACEPRGARCRGWASALRAARARPRGRAGG